MLGRLPRFTARNTSKPFESLSKTVVNTANSPVGYTLACTLLVWLLIFAGCKQLLWRDPHAAFFQEEGVYDLRYSLVRQAEAHTYINDAEFNTTLLLPNKQDKPPPVICAAYATFRRGGREYLNESIGTMLEGLTKEERSILDVRVLFAHTDPTVHSDWGKGWLHVLDNWSGYNVSQEQLEHLRELENVKNFYEKGV
jgi:hypothetical protein